MEARAFPGPFCKEHNLTYFSIFESKSMPLLDEIKNGLVLELRVLYKNDCALLIEIIKRLCTPFKDINYKTLQTYILRLVEKKNKFSSKKKVKGYDNVHAFLNDIFSVGKTSCTNVTQDHTVTTCTSQSNKEVEKITLQIPCDNSSTCENASECTSREILNEEIEIIKDIRTTRNSPEKKNNELKFEIDKKLKHIAKLKDEVKRLDENINRRNKLLGHYSVKNVNKREDTAKKNIQVLRETQRKLARDSKLLQSTRTHNKELLVDRSLLQQENDQLKKEITDLKNTLDEEIKKKQKAQKAASYWKTKSRGGAKSEHTNTNSTTEVTDPSSEFCDYDFECGEEFHTKNDDGTFSDSLRMCIIELAALEVAVEKVSPVIKSVTKHLFNREIIKEDLPSSTTVQSIIDEGHYLAKSFIAERLGETESWGLHRDGTTCKRQKILDTSITLSSGDIMSLGFSRVSHETAVKINKTTQEHIKELADLQPNSDDSTSASSYVRDSLQKLAYTMSDRAANEKKASQLLDEWRDSIIETSNGIEKTEVLRFHCMAHCLLGFHTYACTDLRDFECKLKSDNGPFGRDALSCYKTPFKKGTIAERAVQSTSSIFGPVGDHYGARDYGRPIVHPRA